MPKANITEQEFVRICHTSTSLSEIATKTNTNIRNIQRRIKRLEEKYGDLRPKGFYYQQVERFGGHVENINKSGYYKILLFSDAHFWPSEYHPESKSYNIMLQILQDLKPDFIVNGGDSFDGASISRHPKHGWHDGPSVAEELEINQECLGKIASLSPKSTKLWCWGNHDARMDSRLAQNVPEFQGVKNFSLVDHFPDWKFCMSTVFNGHFKITHKWKGGEHAAWNEVIRSGVSYATGHDHACYVRPYTDMRGTRYGIKTGTLCDINGPQFFYRHQNPTSWQEGFVVVHIEDDFIHPETVIMMGEKAYWNGKVYKPS